MPRNSDRPSQTNNPTEFVSTMLANMETEQEITPIHSSEDMLAIRLPNLHISIFVAYFRPPTPIDRIFYQISDALNKVQTSDKVLLVGNYNT